MWFSFARSPKSIVCSFIGFEWHFGKHSSGVQKRLARGKDKQFWVMKMCILNSFSRVPPSLGWISNDTQFMAITKICAKTVSSLRKAIEFQYHLAELASLRSSWAGSSLHSLLLALGRPGGEHGGLDGEWRLPEILVFERLVGADPLGRAVRQKSEMGGKQTGKKKYRDVKSSWREHRRRLASRGRIDSFYITEIR